jgi:hypothetical protein
LTHLSVERRHLVVVPDLVPRGPELAEAVMWSKLQPQ